MPTLSAGVGADLTRPSVTMVGVLVTGAPHPAALAALQPEAAGGLLPPVPTETRLTTWATLVGVAVICTEDVPPLAGMVPTKSQVTRVVPEVMQVQPVPVALTKVMLAGNWSKTRAV